GAHYLAGDTYRHAGTTAINEDLLGELKLKTTHPPIVYSNVTLTTDMVLGPQAQRGGDAPDLGYHYDPLDYGFGHVRMNGNLTFTPGTAVGWFRLPTGTPHMRQGIHLGDGYRITFDGRADAPDYWVRHNVVQEEANGSWAGVYGRGGITGWAWPSF